MNLPIRFFQLILLSVLLVTNGILSGAQGKGREILSAAGAVPPPTPKSAPKDPKGRKQTKHGEDKGEPLPLWELGLGVFSFRAPHYRGANQAKTYVWPLPYVVFRGDVLEAQNTNITTDFFGLKNVSMGISMNAGLPVDSEANDARMGMPSLYPVFEVGPLLVADLWTSSNKKNFITFEVPMRKVFALKGIRPRDTGFFSVPYFAFVSNPQKSTLGFFSAATISWMFASDKFHNYYYGVPHPYGIPHIRPPFKAKGGYSGIHYTWFLSRRVSDFYFFGFMRYDNLRDAVFKSSPLVKRRDYLLFGGGFVWFFLKSSRKQRSKLIR